MFLIDRCYELTLSKTQSRPLHVSWHENLLHIYPSSLSFRDLLDQWNTATDVEFF